LLHYAAGKVILRERGERERRERETQNTDEQSGGGKGREFSAGEFTTPGGFSCPLIYPSLSLSLTHTLLFSPPLSLGMCKGGG